MAELASPLAGGIQAVRRTVPSSVFAPPPAPAPAEPDPVTTSLIQQNSTALGGVSQQLASISGRINQLSMSLTSIQSNLAASSQIDQQREAAKQNREAQLAEQGLREGKEGQIEQKIQNALFTPIQKIASKTQGLLSRLTSFLFTIGGAWLVDKVVLTVKALSTKNTDLLKSIISNVTKNVLVIGGLLLLTRGKIGSIKGILMSLRTGVLRVATAGLILAPFEAIINLFKRAWNWIASNTPGLGGLQLPEISGQKKKVKDEDVETVGMEDIQSGDWIKGDKPGEKLYYDTTKKEFVPKEDFTGEIPDTSKKVEDGTDGEKGEKGDKGDKGDTVEKEKGWLNKGMSNIGKFIAPLMDFFVDTEYEDDNKADGDKPKPESVNPDTTGGGDDEEEFVPIDQFKEELKKDGKTINDAGEIVPINKNKQNNVSQKISVNEEDLSGSNLIASSVTSSQSGNEGAVQAQSGTNTSGGDKQTPIISSSNNANNYVYNSYKNYQVVPA